MRYSGARTGSSILTWVWVVLVIAIVIYCVKPFSTTVALMPDQFGPSGDGWIMFIKLFFGL